MPVQIAVSHSASVKDHAVVEERAGAILGRLQLFQEIGEQLDVVGVNPRFFGDQFRIVAVVGYGMALFRHSDIRVRTSAEFAGNHQGKHPCDVGTEGQCLKI